MLWDLFFTFLMIGFVSFGGGYGMIPLIQDEAVHRHAWMTTEHFADVIAVAGMSPGPIAANSAIFIGYSQAGILGALVSAAGMVLPSFMIILIVAAFFYRIHQSKAVKSAFYGLRSIITGLIVYAALLFAVRSGMIAPLSWHMISLVLIYAASLIALIRFRLHPIFVIMISGVIGAVVYS
jgi:chromate transporter